MKTTIRLLTCAVVAAMSMAAARAALNIPSDGSDGALVITANTVIDLSQAVTGNWDANNSANAGGASMTPASGRWCLSIQRHNSRRRDCHLQEPRQPRASRLAGPKEMSRSTGR